MFIIDYVLFVTSCLITNTFWFFQTGFDLSVMFSVLAGLFLLLYRFKFWIRLGGMVWNKNDCAWSLWFLWNKLYLFTAYSDLYGWYYVWNVEGMVRQSSENLRFQRLEALDFRGFSGAPQFNTIKPGRLEYSFILVICGLVKVVSGCLELIPFYHTGFTPDPY